MRDPKERFTDRVDDYARWRPGYPDEVATLLARECDLGPKSTVADLGSGTGILTRLLLRTGARVIAVEPNAAMRAEAERDLAGEAGFVSVDGSAEATGLAAESVDGATAAQAFHWFDPVATRAELVRVLRPGGWVALVWNVRRSTPFNDAYEALLVRFSKDYPAVRTRDRASQENAAAFFAPAPVQVAHFDSGQSLDGPGLRGRYLSSSYAPKVGAAAEEALRELDALFAANARSGRVAIAYDTVVYWGRLR